MNRLRMNLDTLIDKQRTANSIYQKFAARCAAKTFVGNQNLVLRINNCGRNRQLLAAANRYVHHNNSSFKLSDYIIDHKIMTKPLTILIV
jgi:hypothetical protein